MPQYRSIRPLPAKSQEPGSPSSKKSSKAHTKLIAQQQNAELSLLRTSEKQRNNQACNECRRSRVKCDGGRPICTTCKHKGRVCNYMGATGQTRIEATKDRLSLLEKVISTLQSVSPDQAADFLNGIRSSEDLTTLLSRLAVDTPEQETPSAVASSVTESSSSRRESTISRPDGAGISPHPPLSNASPLLSSSASQSQLPISSLEQDHHLQSPALPENENVSIIVPPLSGSCCITLPDAKDVARAIQGFFRCSGKIFHVYSEEEVSKMQDAVYGISANTTNASPPIICCLMSVAAVGAQYEHGTYNLQTEAAFYDIAKHYFDSTVQERGLDAIKASVMLSIYNIMHKATVALAYIEVGLSLLRQYQSGTKDRGNNEIPVFSFGEIKQTWRALTFLSSWMSSTLGYISGNDVMPYQSLPSGLISGEADVVEIVQEEMMSIAILKSKILQIHMAFKDVTILSVRAILQDLRTWYGRLPPQIRLNYEGRHAFTPLTKWSIYHVHLLYLGANILLYRGMSSQLIETFYFNTGQHRQHTPLEKLYSDYGEQAVLAAKISARILGLLLQDCGIFKRCWLVIFQAYNSCLIILHSAMQKVLHDWPAGSWRDDLQKVRLCLKVLAYCASSDSTARRFHGELKDFYDYITAQVNDVSEDDGSLTSELLTDELAPFVEASVDACADTGLTQQNWSYLTTIPPKAKADNVERSYCLLINLCRPFGDPEHRGLGIDDVKQRWRDEPTRGLHTLMMARLDWDLESRLAFRWNMQKFVSSDILRGEISQDTSESVGFSHQTLPGIEQSFEDRFLGSTEPSGWSHSKGVEDICAGLEKHLQSPVDDMAID